MDLKFEASFGKEGAGPGEFNIPFRDAVQESTGDVFVLDFGNRRVEVLEPTGNM